MPCARGFQKLVGGEARTNCSDSCFQESLFRGKPLFRGGQTIHILLSQMKKINSCTCAHIDFVLNFPTRRIQLQRVDTNLFARVRWPNWPRGCRSEMAMAVLVRTLLAHSERNQAISRHFRIREAASCRASISAYICHMPRHQVVSTAVASKQFDSAAMPEGCAAGGGRREDAETEGRDSGQRQGQRPTPKHTASETRNIAAVPGTGGIPTTIAKQTVAPP